MIGSMKGKTVVVTGASGGIGLETTRALAGMGARVYMVARNRARAEAAIAEITRTVPGAELELVMADLYSLAEVRRAGAELRERTPHVDVLVNNAGLIHDTRELTVDGFERTFALNHLAAFLITYELRELLGAGSRIVTVSSVGHRFARFDWDDLATMTAWKGASFVYGASKLCNIWFAREASKRLASKQITSNSLHPGGVASNFGASGSVFMRLGTRLAKPLLLTPAKGARTSIYLASSPEVEGVTGKYFVRCKVSTPSRRARDDDSARRLWELSEKLCEVSWP